MKIGITEMKEWRIKWAIFLSVKNIELCLRLVALSIFQGVYNLRLRMKPLCIKRNNHKYKC